MFSQLERRWKQPVLKWEETDTASSRFWWLTFVPFFDIPPFPNQQFLIVDFNQSKHNCIAVAVKTTMLSTRTLLRRTLRNRRCCWLSTSSSSQPVNDKDNDTTEHPSNHLTRSGDAVQEVVRFVQEPSSVPVILDSKEHVVGYLSKILNARVYDAAIETELQHAKNLSSVRTKTKREREREMLLFL